MTAQGQRRPSPILLILLAFFVLAAAYSVVVPLGEGPDEAPHFTVIRYIVQHRHLPSTAEEHEAFQPPLYYLLGAGLTSWADYTGYTIKANADYSLEPGRPHNLLLHTSEESWPYRGWALAWHVLRLFSVLCGVLTVWAVYALGREAFPAQPAAALLMAGITAFSPGFLFLSAMVNNDNLATAISACLLWQSARVIRGRHEGWRIAGLGIGLGLGVLSKANVGLTAVPIGAALAYAAWRREGSLSGTLKRVLGWGVMTAGLALAVCGWWLWHNYQTHGDPTGWSFILQTNALREGPLTPAVLWWLAKGLFTSFWMRWQGLALPGWLYALLLALCLTAAAGWVRLAVRRQYIPPETWAILLMLALQCLAVLAALLQWTATVLGTDQARLVYPALPAIALFLAKGLLAWVPARRQDIAAGALVTAFAIFGLAALIAVVAPVFAPPAPISAEELPADAVRQSVMFQGGEPPVTIELVAYRLRRPAVRAGDWVVVELFWRARGKIASDIWLSMSLAQDVNHPLVVKDGSPSAGRDTTDRWPANVILPAEHWLRVPEHAAPGEYTLWLGLHPFGSWDWLTPAPSPDPYRLPLTTVRVAQ